jgi:ADP-heptose:LPS heptosyltransferase
MTARHVIIARLDSVGDVLLAGPAVRAVAASGADVTMLVSSIGAGAAALLPGVTRVVTYDAPWILADPGPVDPVGFRQFVDDLARLGADEACILTSRRQSPLPTALALRLAGVPRIAAISEHYPGSLLDVRLLPPGDVHETKRALSVVAGLGYTLPEDDDGRLLVQPDHAAAPPLPASYVVLHPGASVSARSWPLPSWLRLAAILRGAAEVVVTGGKGEAELTAPVAAAADGIDVGGHTTLGGLAAVLAGARCVVAANTGPAHLAAAVGTPVVSLFAPTVPASAWRPWGVPTLMLMEDVPCAGCHARVCPIPTHPCMTRIQPVQVADAVFELAGASVEVAS